MSDRIESVVHPGGSVQAVTPTLNGLAVDLLPLIQKAIARHPGFAVPHDRFLQFLLKSLSMQDSPLVLDALHIEDLYLAYAYGLGIEAAQVQVEVDHFARIKRRLERMQTSPSIIADILQELRCRMVEMQHPDFSGRTYSGRGSLGGWLFIAAVRIAERRTERAQHEFSEHDQRFAAAVQERLLPALDPEMEHLIHSYKAAFEVAMQQGLAALSCRERSILRYHFCECLSIDRLAEIYNVHRATAARWIVRAQQHLADETRTRFSAQIPVAAESVPRLIALIRSKLNLSLSAVLKTSMEAES